MVVNPYSTMAADEGRDYPGPWQLIRETTLDAVPPLAENFQNHCFSASLFTAT
jgi:hypothetical protein